MAARPDLGQGGHPGGHDRRAARRPPRPAGSRSPSAGPRTTSARARPARPSARRSSARRSTGRTAQVMGDPDQPHSYSYTPDVAAGADHPRHRARRRRRGLAPAGRRDPHHPRRSSSRSTRSPATGPACFAAGAHHPAPARRWSSRRCASTCTRSTSSPTAGSSTTASSAPRSATTATPLDDALATTLAWYRDRAAATTPTEPTASSHEGAPPWTHQTTRPPAPPPPWPSPPLLAIAGFTALGSVFDYPQILEEPTADILALYREHQGAVIGLVPRARGQRGPAGPGRRSCSAASPAARLGRWIAGVGIAAATVQVIGLSRWVLLVPGISDDALDPAQRADADGHASSCCTPGSARSSARPSATPSPPPSPCSS